LPIERVIPPDLAEAFRQALAARTDKFDALFLTDKKRPYKRGGPCAGSGSGTEHAHVWLRNCTDAQLRQGWLAMRNCGRIACLRPIRLVGLPVTGVVIR
jgi:hypothetical protein